MKEVTLPAGRIKRIHVHRANIARNVKDGGKRPQWIVQTSKGPISCHGVEADDVFGSWPDAPQLSCGARVYLVTTSRVVVHIDETQGSDWLTTRAKELINES